MMLEWEQGPPTKPQTAGILPSLWRTKVGHGPKHGLAPTSQTWLASTPFWRLSIGPHLAASSFISLRMVLGTLCTPMRHKVGGADDWSPGLMLKLPHSWWQLAADLWNTTLECGRVPKQWKNGRPPVEVSQAYEADHPPFCHVESWRALPATPTRCLGRNLERRCRFRRATWHFRANCPHAGQAGAGLWRLALRADGCRVLYGCVAANHAPLAFPAIHPQDSSGLLLRRSTHLLDAVGPLFRMVYR